MPTNRMGGSTQLSSVLNAPVEGAPLNSTPCFCRSLAMSVGTRSVVKVVAPFFCFSLYSPRITSPAIVTLPICPASSCFWKSL